MLRVLSEKEVEEHHQEIRDWVNDVLDDKYGSFPYNMLNSLMSNFKDMSHELEIYKKERDEKIAKNRKMLGLPPLKKK